MPSDAYSPTRSGSAPISDPTSHGSSSIVEKATKRGTPSSMAAPTPIAPTPIATAAMAAARITAVAAGTAVLRCAVPDVAVRAGCVIVSTERPTSVASVIRRRAGYADITASTVTSVFIGAGSLAVRLGAA